VGELINLLLGMESKNLSGLEDLTGLKRKTSPKPVSRHIDDRRYLTISNKLNLNAFALHIVAIPVLIIPKEGILTFHTNTKTLSFH